MTEGESQPETPSLHLEIPIEPLPTGPLVPRPAPRPEPEPEPAPEPAEAVAIAEPESPTVETPTVERDEPTVDMPAVGRDEAGPGALRPATPRPASSSRPARSANRPPDFTDRRRPFRATLGLIVLVFLGSLALAAAIGLAIAVIAFAVRSSVG